MKSKKDKSFLKRKLRKSEIIWSLNQASRDKHVSKSLKKEIKDKLKKKSPDNELRRLLSRAKKDYDKNISIKGQKSSYKKNTKIKSYDKKISDRGLSKGGAWGRTKIQLKHFWDRNHKLDKPIKSMKESKNFDDWLKKLQNDEKQGKRKPKWAGY